MKKVVSVFSLLLIASFVLSACGNAEVIPAEGAGLNDIPTPTPGASISDANSEVKGTEGDAEKLKDALGNPGDEGRFVTYTIEFVDDFCPEIHEIVGGNSENWRRIDTNFNDVQTTAIDGCGWRLFDFNSLSLVVDIPEGWVLNKTPKTYGPAVIRTNYQPVTIWKPDYSEGCPLPSELALGTEESDWTRLDQNNDGAFDTENDYCGYELTFNTDKDLTFNIPEGVEANQPLEVYGVQSYHTNRLEVSVWILDEYLDQYK